MNIKNFITHHYQSLEAKYNSKNKIFSPLIIILLSFNFILLGIEGINASLDPQGWDTTAYLGEANFIKNQGGAPNFLNLCFTGQYKQANQHPLYILLLTPFASIDISFFINAKIMSLIIGFILLLVVYFIGKRMFGNLIASLVVFALLLNKVFLEWTTLVACESLLMLFSFLCIYFVIKGFNKNKYWAYAGVFAGLAYLTKGTRLILIPGFGLSAIIIYKLKIFKSKYFWSFFIFFTIVASPLLVRNVIVYQNPFFNVNNYIITYGTKNLEESRYLTFSSNEGATLWKFDKFEKNSSKLKTSDSSSFSVLTSLSKMIRKIRHDVEIFLVPFNILKQHWTAISLWISGILLLLFFIIGLSRKNNKGGKIYFLSTIIVFLVVLLFNPIDRYFLPLVPLICLYIAFGIFTLLDLINKWISLKNLKFNLISYIPHVIIITILVYSGFVLINKTIAKPLHSLEYNDSRLELLNWLRKNLQKNEKYTLDPNFNWQLEKGIWIHPPDNAKLRDFSKFKLFIRKHSFSYIIIDRNSFKDKLKLLENNFVLDPTEGVIEKKSVDGWELVYKDHKKPVDFLV